MTTSGIRDNFLRGNVGDFLREYIQSGSKLSVVSAYFTIYAYDALKEKLNGVEQLRFLFGEPRFVTTIDPDRNVSKSFIIQDDGLQLSNHLEQKRIAKECADWIGEKVEIRSVLRSNLLHGKMYHVDNQGVEEAILGSSNFTISGLGLGANNNNIELNLIVDSRRDRNDLNAWFNEIWNDEELVKDVKAEVLRYLEQLYQNNAPEFIYYKTLFHIFEDYLSDLESGRLLERSSLIVDTQVWSTLFEFQKDGVKGAINKILNYNGCVIADSVGLGKTYEALAIIKYFELLNYRALVLCPKKLRENWTVYKASVNSVLNPFPEDRFAYTVLSHTDLSREAGYSGDVNLATFNWGNYDLVVIDESHNFRNNTPGKRDDEGKIIRRSRYQRLMEDVIQGKVKTKVLLLSATPVNNNLKDLRNQIYFITENRDDAFKDSLGIYSIESVINTAQKTFNKWASDKYERNTSELLEKLNSAFFKLLDALTIARSRKHIKRYYHEVIQQLGGFPKRLKPISIFADIDREQKFLSYDTLNDHIAEYKLSLFNPSNYLLPEFTDRYELDNVLNFTQQQRENFLIGMMKVNFLKRLESSIYAFNLTMQRTVEKIEDLQNRIGRFKQFQEENPELDFDDLEIEDLDDEELQSALQVGRKLVFQMAHLDVDAWLEDLKHDHENIYMLYLMSKDVTPERDVKLAELKKLILQKVSHPTRMDFKDPTIREHGPHECKKVLVFTAFADTAKYLYDQLYDWASKELGVHIALVTGGSSGSKTTLGLAKYDHILMNFAPFAKQRHLILDANIPQNEEIDILIATDCISEGQNLQDCDYLINYDIHWNPVRILQRFGRIDRIGSHHKAIQMVNFWPTADLDKYISLKNRVEARMALVDISATFEDNLLDQTIIKDLIKDELSYRDKQLLRLREEVLDLEDFDETISLNEFTLDDFRMELNRYIESNRKLLEEAPLGLHAVVHPDSRYPAIRPGVVFCMRQQGELSEGDTVNPLQPFFLVYVLDEGSVRFSFAQPKQILEILRATCGGKAVPHERLCDLFDQETHNGAQMSHYNDLLENAVKSIVRTFKRRAIRLLGSGREAVLPNSQNQVQETSDFELITWVVIKDE